MKNIVYALIGLIIFSGYTKADYQVPPLKIKGAEKALEVDDFVQLYTEQPEVKPQYWVGVTYEWRVFYGYKERKFRQFEAAGKNEIEIIPPKEISCHNAVGDTQPTKNLLVELTAAHLYID